VRVLEAEVAEKESEVDAARLAAAAELEARSADEARAREERLEAELQRAESALEAMRRMHQTSQSQLFTVQEKGEEAAAAARAEAELAAEEVERAQERLALLARERDALLKKMEQENLMRTGNGGADADGDSKHFGEEEGTSSFIENATVSALREELRTQRELASRLQAELSSAVRSVEGENVATTAKLNGLQASLHATEAHAAALEAELAGRPTRQELEDARQQIRVLHAVVHNAVGEEIFQNNSTTSSTKGAAAAGGGGGAAARVEGGSNGSDMSTSTTNTTINSDIGIRTIGSLESALLAKNRHLEHKLTMSRLDMAEAQSTAEAAVSKVTELELELERQKGLVEKLEEDLIAAERAAELAGEAATPKTTAGNDGGTDASGRNTSLSNGGDSNYGGTEQSMVQVLSGQRDRLRARVQELESNAAIAAQTLAKAKQDVAAARADNVSLIEQLRYVQGYAPGTNNKDLEAGSSGQSQSQSGTTAAVIGRYMKEYEDRTNPLNDFRSREREARRRAMPIQDRAAVALGSALVGGSKVAKSAIMVYAFVLHMVAFIVLAGFSSRHVDKLEELEEMCAQLRPVGGLGGAALVAGEGLDPVVGGSVAAMLETTGHALLRKLFK
jgi:homeobox protein cut-like